MSATIEPPAPADRHAIARNKPTSLPEQVTADPDRLLTGSQLAARLGVSKRTIEHWSSTGVIPKVRIGSRFSRYRLHKVQAALDRYETSILRK